MIGLFWKSKFELVAKRVNNIIGYFDGFNGVIKP